MAVAGFREAFPKKSRSGYQSSPPHGPGAGPPVRASDPTNVSGVHDAINQSRIAGIGGPDPGPNANDESGTNEALRTPAKAAVQNLGPDPTEGFHQPACQPRTGPVTWADQRGDSLKYTFRLWVDRPDATMSKRPSPSRSASVRSSQAMPSSSTHTFIHRFPTGT